jgi:hypothetical protein
MVPILVCAFLFQYLVSIQFDPLAAIAIIVSIGIPTIYGLREWQIRQTEYLKGKEILMLRFRLRRGKWFEDFALVKGWKLLNPRMESMSKIIPEMQANPQDLQVYLYEVEFEDYPYFDKLVLYSPCTKDELLQFTPQMVLWKQFICGATAAAISVVRLKEVFLGPEGIVPHVYPIDSDYEAETLQSLAGFSPINSEIAKRGPEIYEAVKYAEILKLYEGAQRDLATKDEIIEDMGDKAARMAARLFEEAAEAGKLKRSPGIFSGFMKWCKKHWKLLTIFGILLCVFMIILYGGYLIH